MEDQSKYHLSYPKSPALDMKWENHHVNVVLRPIECLAPTVKFDIFTTISRLFFCRPTLELTTFERHVSSATPVYWELPIPNHWEQTGKGMWPL